MNPVQFSYEEINNRNELWIMCQKTHHSFHITNYKYMAKDVNQAKIDMWTKKLAQLEKELEDIYVKKGEAAREGDLSENAAYKMAMEDAETWRVRIDEVKKIIEKLEAGGI